MAKSDFGVTLNPNLPMKCEFRIVAGPSHGHGYREYTDTSKARGGFLMYTRLRGATAIEKLVMYTFTRVKHSA